jgi:2-polyprenyl-3-methyl-5-hydroxy-6-metoxy-1,4-benzoquinol methylase
MLSRAFKVFVEKGFVNLLKEIKIGIYRYRIKSVTHMNSCNICTSRHISLFLGESPASLYRCDECGLIFYNPLPSLNSLQEYYSSEEGYLPSIKETMRVYEDNNSNRVNRYKEFLERIMKYIDNPKKILDSGCGYGFFLLFCKQQGFDPSGIEVSLQTSSWAREQGLNVFTGSVHEAPFKENFFDVVTAFHCLEHVLDPTAEIAKIASFCRKEGIFLLAVPNASSLVAENSFSTWKWKAWPNHLFYFSPENLKLLLVRAGFEILDIYSQVGDSDIDEDRRVLAQELNVDKGNIDKILNFLYELNKGQELIIISRKK